MSRRRKKKARRGGRSPRGSGTQERSPLARDLLLARVLRALRCNPHVEGALVIRYLATAFAKRERGWGPDSPRSVPEHELVEWTRVIFIFLVSFSVDLKGREPDVSADADWALTQVGLTAEEVRDAPDSELRRLARLVWADAGPT